uniref:Mucin-5AC-like n=1 Tax=Crassostrea virginica TaxID=6565 RepID=A0A8B8CA22_CRAVI|nr:mucin-5AC-like [Crassostrea virginica]
MTRETTKGPEIPDGGTNMQPATTTLKSALQETGLYASSTVSASDGIETGASTGSDQTTMTATASIAVSGKTETPQQTTVSSKDTVRASVTDTVSTVSTVSPVNADSGNTRVTEPRQNNGESSINSDTFASGDNSEILTKTRIPPKDAENQTTEDKLSKIPSATVTEEILLSSTVSASDIEGKSVTISSLDSKMESTTSELPTTKSSTAKATLVKETTRDDANVVSRETTQSPLLKTSSLIIGTTIRSMTIAESTARSSSVSSAPTTQSAPGTSHSTSASDHVVDGHLPTSSKEKGDINLSRKTHKSAPNDSNSSTPKVSDNFLFGPEIHQHDHYLCESHSFHCSEMLCIPSSWVCDGERNCPDGRDEGLTICNKDRVCPTDEYKCSNFRCIPGSWLCDGEEDCPKKEDESAAAGCFMPDLDPVTETVTFESIISSMFNSSTMILFNSINDIRVHIPFADRPRSVDTNTTGTNMTVIPGGPGIEPGEKSYTASAGLGSLESIAIAAAAGLVFLINVIGIILALTRRNRRKLDKKQPSTMSTSVTSSDDAESGSFKIPRPNVLYPPYYVKDDWNTWNSSHFTNYAEQMYAMDEHSDFYPGSLKTL